MQILIFVLQNLEKVRTSKSAWHHSFWNSRKIIFLDIQFFIVHSNASIVWKSVDQNSTNVAFSKSTGKFVPHGSKIYDHLQVEPNLSLIDVPRKWGLIWTFFCCFLTHKWDFSSFFMARTLTSICFWCIIFGYSCSLWLNWGLKAN